MSAVYFIQSKTFGARKISSECCKIIRVEKQKGKSSMLLLKTTNKKCSYYWSGRDTAAKKLKAWQELTGFNTCNHRNYNFCSSTTFFKRVQLKNCFWITVKLNTQYYFSTKRWYHTYQLDWYQLHLALWGQLSPSFHLTKIKEH